MLLAAACNDDTPQPTPVQVTDIVTAMLPSSGVFILERGAPDDCRTLLSDHGLPGVSPGERVLTAYTFAAADTVVGVRRYPIHLQWARRINFDTISPLTPDAIRRLPAPQLSVTSTWQTGNYINCQVMILFDGEQRGFGIVADETTLRRDTVECYLYNTGHEVSEASVRSRAFGSFCTSALGLNYGQYIRLHTDRPD